MGIATLKFRERAGERVICDIKEKCISETNGLNSKDSIKEHITDE